MSRSSVAPSLPVALLGSLAVVALSACGTDDPQLPQAPSTTVTKRASFPLTVNRVGGIAGFDDSVSIQADGGVIARTKQGQVTCTLDPASLAVLNDAASTLHDTDQPTGSPSTMADRLDVLFGAGTGLVHLDDSRVVKAEPVVTQLLADVSGPAADRKVCT